MAKESLKMRFLFILARFWLKTLRIRGDFLEEFKPGVLGIWHEDLAAATAAFAKKNVYAMISASQDGEYFTSFANTLGYHIIRGSSNRHAENVRFLLPVLLQENFVAMALDGPRGPVRKEKPGAAYLAKKTNRPIYKINVKYGAKWELSSWDKAKIPLPFSKVTIKIVEEIL